MSATPLEYLPGSLKIHIFNSQIMNMNIVFQVYQLEGSLIIWIGTAAEPVFKDLSVSMSVPYEKQPLSMKLLGDPVASDETSTTMALRLGKRLKKQVFASFNIPGDPVQILPLIEQRLAEEFHVRPDVF